MKTSHLTFGSEWALLELVSISLTTAHQQELFEELIKSKRLHWGELLEQALRHKILPLLAFYLTLDQFENIPKSLKKHLQTVLDLNRAKTTIFRDEAAKIVKVLNEPNVRFVGTKGIVFESTLYEGNGSRYMNDMDFMITPSQKDTVKSVISQLGYQTGEFDWSSGKVKSHSRKDMMTYQLNPDHLPASAKLIDNPIIRCVHIDFANSLTWTRSPFDVPVETALAEISYQSIPGYQDIQMPCFSPTFQFIFTILHLFREAWFERWLNWKQDVNLSKFADVIRLWRANQATLESKDFVQTLEEFKITEPILWVLEHTDRTFHTEIVSALGLEGRVSEDWLASAYAPGGKLRMWKGTMRERLHCKDRRKLFADTP
jgi:hypothetical protein